MSLLFKMFSKILLIILDGWGLREEKQGNAIKIAKTSFFDSLWTEYPHAVLKASGKAVGLPKGQMGTSEVNHITIGAGRVVPQDLVRINNSIKDGSFFKNKVLIKLFKKIKTENSVLHIKGLFSPGGVHSHQKHFYALLNLAKQKGLKKVYLHLFTDGRDTLPKSALKYIQELEKEIKRIGVGKIASVCGRYYAMDRDHNWQRTDSAFQMLVKGKGRKFDNAQKAVQFSYDKGISDEFIEPSLIKDNGKLHLIKKGDGVVFVNFRNDRPRQLVERFLEQGPENLKYVTFCQYSPDYQVDVVFSPLEIEKTLGEIVAEKGIKQLRITETEKFAHLTFFMNFRREEPFEGEDRIMLNSYSDVDTHDQKPEMRTPDIAQEIVEDIRAQKHALIFTNLCNADMVGHTGNVQAAVKGIEIIDKALKKIIPEALENGFHTMITADHGNAEEMLTEEGKTVTAHTTNPVPFILVSKKYQKLNRDKGSLIDIAPTVLKILNIAQPTQMTGKSFV